MREEKLDFWLRHGFNVCFVGRHGVGKCLNKGTPILMFDGSIKAVENIKNGEQVMGPDSLPRTVQGTTSGRDQMYKIAPTKGDPFVCNSVHMLTLRMCSDCGWKKKNEIFDMPLNEFLCQSKKFQRRAMLFRTGVDFQVAAELPQPAYMLGLWLGDGTAVRPEITNIDLEVIDYLYNYAHERALTVNKRKPAAYYISSGSNKKGLLSAGRNEFLSFLQKYNLVGNKHIPHAYLTASRDDRLQLLAGLLDTDGELVHNCYSITQKSRKLADEILFLARSLGFAAYLAPCTKFCVYKGKKKVGIYYRITISGNIQDVPCLIRRKISSERKQKKNVLNTAFKVMPWGEGDYYGFTLDGDGRFLLGDFTVTHNTAMVKACYERAGLVHGDTYLYFSGSTLDPWVDFVGVPKEKTIDKIPDQMMQIREIAAISTDIALEWVIANMKLSKDSAKKVVDHALGLKEGVTVLELVRPKVFALDRVQAIFVDEYNRSAKKVRNAVMELIQFKSINGKVFTNLKTVWTAINPDEDDEYDVEALDPAQQDRFVVSIKVPYKPNEMWFVKRYGERVGRAAIQWWANLNAEEQKAVSPRRLEYALNMWDVKGDMRDVLPMSANVLALMQSLNVGPTSERIEELFRSKDDKAAKLFISNENNYAPAMKVITESEQMMDFFIPLLNKEKLALLLSDNERARRFICASFGQYPIFQDVMRDVLGVNQNKTLVKTIRRALADNTVLATGFGPGSGGTPAPAHFAKWSGLVKVWGAKLTELKAMPNESTAQRTKLYNDMIANIPEEMTGEEAVATLELLNYLMTRAWITTLTNETGENKMPLIINMTNHAIAQLALAKNLSWTEITATYGLKMKNLLDKIKEADLAKKLFTPAKS